MSDYPKGSVVPCASQSCEFLVMNAEGGWAHVDTHGKPTDHKAAPKPVTASAPPLVDVIAEALAGHWSASTHTDQEPFVDKCDGCGEAILIWGGDGDSYKVKPENLLAAHQARVVRDALTKAGGVEWGVFRRGGDQRDLPLERRTFTTEAAARNYVGRSFHDLSWLEIRSRIAGPWTAVE